MNTATLSASSVEKVVRTIADQQDHMHTLEMSNDLLLLDGLPVTIRIEDAELHLSTDVGTYCVTNQAFWYAFAGAEPTAEEAGRLLADSLIRMQLLHQMRQVQATFQRLSEQVQAVGSVPLPTYSLSPFVQQTLEVYDGTPETAQLLARILRQDVSTIDYWATLLGKEGPTHAGDTSCATERDSTPEKPPVKHFRWTTDLARQLEAAFWESTATTMTITINEIAQRFDWPIHAVQYKLYDLQLPQRKHQQAQQREAHAVQEGD